MATAASAQQVELNVNLNAKHRVGEVETFDRHKFVNFHSTIDQNNWNNNNEEANLIEDLLRERNVFIGRNTGTISWNLRNQVSEDPNRPGFANVADIISSGQSSRNNYASKTWAHQYEDLNEEILCTQIHPFYPDGKTTNNGWAFSQTDTEEEPLGTASGEYYANFIEHFYGTGGTTGKPKPKYVEITNEPLWDLVTTADQPHSLTKIFEFHSTVAKEIRKMHDDVLIGGYCAAFPNFEENNFQRWHERDKHFMDVAGADMDYWTIHLYDFPVFNGKTQYRKGSNMEATMDMLEQYSMLKFGEVKPLMISEYNAQTHDVNRVGHLPYVYWLKVKSTFAMMMQFMERSNNINYAMPFFMLKAEWQYNAEAGPTSVHGSRMLRREDEPSAYSGDFIYTEAIQTYDMLMGLTGTRVDSYSSNPDIMVDSYVDGNKAYVMIHNLDIVSHDLDVNLAGFAENATDVEIRHHYLNGTSTSSIPLVDIKNSDSFENDLEIAPEGTYVLVFSYPSDIVIEEEVLETKYYADTYLKQISASDPLTFNIDGVTLAEQGEAVLRVGVGRDHDLSLKPRVTLNGNNVTVPSNFRGLGQDDRDNFFGVLEIPVPYAILSENNEVEIAFSDNGGHVSTVTMQVFNFSSDFRDEVEIPLSVNTLGIEVYPNPADQYLKIRSSIDKEIDASIFNLFGQTLLQQSINEGANTVDTSSLQPGVYILELKTGDEVTRQKIIVE
ncbi:MAG: T9SS type A sorting domain-containing protein [Bacteroidota bacterium]